MSGRKRKGEEHIKQRQKKSKKSSSEAFFKEEKDVISFYALPPEIIMQILTVGRVDAETLEALRRTNKQLYNLITDPTSKKALCRELRESLSRLRTPEGILGWLQRHQMIWESEEGEDSLLFFKEEDGVAGTLIYRHQHPDDVNLTGTFRAIISTLYDKDPGNLMDPRDEPPGGITYEVSYRVPDDIPPSKMTSQQDLARPEYKTARSEFNKLLRPVLQEMLDRGARFGTALIQREPEMGVVFQGYFESAAAPDQYWFVRGVKKYLLYAKGSHLQDDTARDHPYCRDLM